jgi:uncharacterized lipoprotein YmbA
MSVREANALNNRVPGLLNPAGVHTSVRVLCLALPLASACLIPRAGPDPTRYFVLTSENGGASGAPAQLVLGLDRIDLPEYLTRLELATRSASNQLTFAEYNRWGEAVKDGFARTLRSDLEAQLGASHIVTPPFDAANRPALTVDVEVRRFERVLPDGAVLEATWTLRDGKTGAALVAKEARVRQPVERDDAGATVAALSKTLVSLAREIADGVRARAALRGCYTPGSAARRPARIARTNASWSASFWSAYASENAAMASSKQSLLPR